MGQTTSTTRPLGALLQRIEAEYPFPIAACVRRYRMLDPDEVLERHDILADLFEVSTKYIAIIALQDALSHSAAGPDVQSFLRNLLNPALGHWNELLRIVASGKITSCPRASEIASFYRSSVPVETRRTGEALQTSLPSEIKIRSYKDLFDLLIVYRNKTRGHGAKTSREEYASKLVLLEDLVLAILSAMPCPIGCALVFVDSISILPTSELRHKLKRCAGAHIEPEQSIRSSALVPQRLYLSDASGDDIQYLDLHPLLIFSFCQECKSEQIFFFNDFRRTRLEYLSYSCGHFCYPEMLPQDIQRLFKVSLDFVPPGTDLPQKSQSDPAKEGELLVDDGLDKLSRGEVELAVAMLQASLALRETETAYFYSAIGLAMTGGHLQEIRFNLESCTRLNPAHEEAQRFLGALTQLEQDPIVRPEVVTSKMRDLAEQLLAEKIEIPKVKTAFEYFCPSMFARKPYLFWALSSSVVFLLRYLISLSLQLPLTPVVLMSQWLGALSGIAFAYLLSEAYYALYYPMKSHLELGTRERFRHWYLDRVAASVGRVPGDRGAPKRLVTWVRLNPLPAAMSATLILIAIASCSLMTELRAPTRTSFGLAVLDWTLLWGCSLYSVWLAVSAFSMFLAYSKLPLKPMVSSATVYNVSRFSSMFVRLGALILFYYALASWSALLSFRSSSRVDLVLQIGCIVAFSMWGVVLPVSLSNAFWKAKLRVIARYSKHVEEAFQQFAASPSADTLAKYEWLLHAEIKLRRLHWLAVSRLDLIALILLELLAIAICAAYWYVRLTMSPSRLLLLRSIL